MDIEKLRQEFQAKLLLSNEWSLKNFVYCERRGEYYDWNLEAMWKGFVMQSQELETLRAENAKLIAEREQYENHDVYATLYEDAKALIDPHTKPSGGELPTSVIQSVEYLFKFWIENKAERAQWMKQEPYGYILENKDTELAEFSFIDRPIND